MSKWPCRVGGCVECKTLTGHDLLILDVTLGTLLTASLPFLLFMNILFFLLYAFCTVVERALSLLGLNDNAKIRCLVMSLRRY